MFSLIVFSLLVSTVAIGKSCTYPNACWPSQTDWNSLNRTLNGRLVRARPAASPCHPPLQNDTACAEVRQNYYKEFWRSEQPGAYQDLAWENGDSYCNIDNDATVPCAQGLVPLYMAQVKSVDDVKAAVCFARDHNLSTRVKGASHDYLGRSSGNGTFGIQTIGLGGIKFEKNFKPAGADKHAQSHSVVHVGAGEHWYYVNKAANATGVQIVGGASYSVGAAGGWILGGGHSSLSPQYGLGVDNVLQFEIVTPDATFRIANAYQNQDLFWALRGGGPGFGVVTRVTYKTYPALQNFVGIFLNVTYPQTSYPGLLKTVLPLQPSWAAHNISGYLYSFPTSFIAAAYVYNSADIAAANSTLQPLYQFADSEKAAGRTVNILSSVTVHHSYMDNFPESPDTKSEGGIGAAAILGSRLLPMETFQDAASVDKLVQLIASTLLEVQLLLVGGGKVSEVAEDATAVHPSWRRARSHTILAGGWNTSTPFSYRDLIRQYTTNQTQVLGSIAPGSGSYVNEGDINEPNWAETFWGSNYHRLHSIKNQVDPKGLFTCYHCVGYTD